MGGEERAKKLSAAQTKLREFIDLASRDKPLDAAALVSYANLSAQLAREMDSFRINEILASDAALKRLHEQVQSKLNAIYIDSPAAQALEKLTGTKLSGPQSQRTAEKQLNAELKNLIETQGRYKTASDEVAVASKTLQQRLAEVQNSAQGTDATLGAMVAQFKSLWGAEGDLEMFRGMAAALQLVREAAAGGSVSLEELQKAAESLQTLESSQGMASGILSGDFKTDVNEAILAAGRLLQAKAALNQVQAAAPDGMSLEAVKSRLGEIDNYRLLLEKPRQDAENMGAALNSARAAMEGATSPAAGLAAYWQSIAASAQAAAAASAQIGVPAATQYHASGGPARGTDTIPAMLSPGEFVVNARSSRRFYSQLSAINASLQPVYRESGGSVTNVGDVSISVSETKTPKQTAREVMNAFRREMRRGSGRL